MLKQELKLKQQQKLSPLQIQTIKLIELPILELEQRIRKEIEENPVLDDSSLDPLEDDEVSLSEVSDNPDESMEDDDDIPSYKLYANNYDPDELPRYNTFSVKKSFSQGLLEQLGFKRLNKHQKAVATFIIGSLDDDGYLRRDIESVVDDLAFRANITTDADEVMEMLRIIQTFEPRGVGARDLRECLLLQLRSLKPTEQVNNAIKILEKSFNDFTGKRFAGIMSKCKLTKEQTRAAMAKIVKLNPSPGGLTDDTYVDRVQQIVPDFVLDCRDGELVMTMPRFSYPELRISPRYRSMIKHAGPNPNKEQKEALTFIKHKMNSAKWFVEALRQRYNTLTSTMQAILDYQYEYFIDGDETHLKPMILKDIADITGLDISTISRVVNSKYIETHFGIYPLKYFFSESMETHDGEEVSTRNLKKVLCEVVDKEDKRKPHTDAELMAEMSKLGYKVARRTIAKYRDQLGIPTARLRKKLI